MDPSMELPGLRDIVLPGPVSYVPATYAWGIVGIVLVAGACVLVARAVRRWRADAYRRRALVELTALRRAFDEEGLRHDALAGLASLLKRTSLSFCPRERVAALSGEEWLAFLEASAPGVRFSSGPARLLESAAYEPPERTSRVPEADVRAVFDAVESWTRAHRRSALDAQGE